jgi:8-amino-7-oxononanoate synthase
LATRVRNALRVRGHAIAAGDSPIIPVILGDPARAVAAAQSLRDAGLLVVAVRPPTVPPGTSRLRITLSAAHTDEQIERLIETISALVPSPGTPGEG